jgi:transcriptional regulator with XRE-family HTH domain
MAVNMVRVKEMLQREIDKGIPKLELARRTRIPNASLANYLTGDIEPRYNSLERIASYFHKPMSWFLEDAPTEYRASEPGQELPTDLAEVLHELVEHHETIRGVIDIFRSDDTGTQSALLQNIKMFYEKIEERRKTKELIGLLQKQANRMRYSQNTKTQKTRHSREGSERNESSA